MNTNGTRARFHTMKVTPTRRGAVVRAVLVVVTMALLGAMLVTMAEAAPRPLPLLLQMDTTVPVEDRVAIQQRNCKDGGGTSETHYEFDVDWDIISVHVSCKGGVVDGVVCENDATTIHCRDYGSFVQPTTSVLPDQRPDTAESLENPQETPPVVDDNAVPPGGEAEDPTGEEQARIVDPAEVCRALGGTANVIDQGSMVPAEIRCTGGALDDMICFGTICDYFRDSTGSEEAPNAPPTGGIADPTGTTPGEITFVQVASMAELEDALLAEDPTSNDTLVIANQSGSTVTDNATGQVLLCRAAGGTETVNENRTVGGGLRWVDVHCKGGLLDGLWCANGSGYTICFFRAALPEDPRVTPAAGIEAPATHATEMPSAAPTSTAVSMTPTAPPPTPSPTVVPTIELVEATAVPTKTLPDPKNDNAAPPGDEAEDPTENEPVPTEAPLR